MLTYNFANVTEPLYEYTYKSIKNDIISGKITPGEKLPSKRTFARNNGVSIVTIQNAYEQLISEGYIYAIEKKGYYVAELNNISAMSKESKVTYDIHIPKSTQYTYDLSGNHMNPNNFPFSNWVKVLREVLSSEKDELMIKSPITGVYELRNAIAEHLKSFRGMLVDPNQIVVGAGTEYLYGLIVQLIGNDKKYAIENPGYKKLVNIYRQYGVEPIYVDMDSNGLMVKGLHDTNVEVAHICPNHHFPTGITMPASRRYEMLAWANEDDKRYIIEDDYDSEFRHNGKPIPTLFSIDNCEKVIYMNTFSKTLTPTIRVSYMVLPVHLANRVQEKLSFLSCTVSNFEQYTLARFINRGFLEKHINRMRLYYMHRRDEMLDIIKNSKLLNKCEVIDNNSGLHFILRLDTSISDAEMGERLRKKDVLIKALSEYYFEPRDVKEHMFIINYSNIDKDVFTKACDIIYENL